MPDAETSVTYRQPPRVVADILDAPAPPAVSMSPTRDTLALVDYARYPPVADLAEPMLRLAGLRINPRTNGPARPPRVTGITLLDLGTGVRRPVLLPAGAKLSTPEWAPDGRRFAVTNTTSSGIELWVGDVATAGIRQVPGVILNGVFGAPITWCGPAVLLAQLVPADRGGSPVPPAVPAGPMIQESSGQAGPVRTYQDLLRNAHDEALFAYHATSQLATIDPATGVTNLPGPPGLYTDAAFSPDGNWLLVERLKKPFSYLHTYKSFPKTIEARTRDGVPVRTVADLPLQDRVPIEGVPTGPRQMRWVPNKPATLLWVEALDGGDPKAVLPHRDELFTLAAPFAGQPTPAGKVEHRFAGLTFFEAGDAALLRDYDRDRRWTRTVLADLADPAAARPVQFDRSVHDRYNDPGAPLLKTLPTGERVLRTTPDGALFLQSAGATPQGEFPTLNLFDPATRALTPLFRCRDGCYETATVLDDTGRRLLIRRESPTDPPDYFLRDGDTETRLTNNPDPFPGLRSAHKELVTTRRADGVTVSFTLYLPPGYDGRGPLPAVFWAYPREFASADTAGQVSGSPFRFTPLAGASPLFLLTQGYAVLDEVSVPVVGPPETANNTFLEQIVMSAAAAVDAAAARAPIDRGRIGVGGHSYGAFMAAHLLAHSNLFRAGVARSGAYNRTLTPFGFQNERRTLWEAPGVYAALSPFQAADRIAAPLLLIHGADDDNPGTFPMQSERMYQAVRGTGGTARLVLLPHEAHGYAARESVGHVLAEMIDWFDRHVKRAGPREPSPRPTE